MFEKFWYFFCLIFLIFNLHLLWLDGYAVNHKNLIANKLPDLYEISICVPIDGLKAELQSLRNYSFDKCYVNSTAFIYQLMTNMMQLFNQTFGGQKDKAKDKIKDERLAQFYFRENDLFLFKKHVCFITDKARLKIFYLFRNLKYRILMVTKSSKSFFFNSVFSNENELSVPVDIKFFKLNVINLRNPFSDCVRDKLNNQVYSKFNCLNQCLKRKDSKYIYFYSVNNEETINLNETTRDFEQERHCYGECRKENCILEYNLAVVITDVKSRSELQVKNSWIPIRSPNIDEEYLNFEVYPTITLVDFWFQFVGLICLFLNINFNETIPGLIKLAYLKSGSKQNQQFRNKSPKIKFAFLILNIFILTQLLHHMQQEYDYGMRHAVNTQISLFSTRVQKLSLLLCIPVQQVLYPQIENQKPNLDPKLDDLILRNYSFAQIEALTNNGLKLAINKTFLSYATLWYEVRFHVLKKVFFRNSFYLHNKTTLFSRCFNVHLDLREERYKTLLGITKLILNINEGKFIAIYLIESNKDFHYDSYQYLSKFQIVKRTFRKSNLSLDNACKNYELDNKLQCDSKPKCLNNCRTFHYLQKHYKFLINRTVIDKDEYNSYLFNNTYFTNEDDANITDECKSMFKEDDCEDDVYMSSYKKYFPTSNNTIINLYFEIVLNKDMLPNPFKYGLSVLNIASILFGINFMKMLLTLLALIKVTFRIKWYFWYQPLVFLISLLLCSLNIYVIFRDLIMQELLPNGYFVKESNSSVPDLIFCLKYDKQDIDPNHKITVAYLDNLTRDLTFDSLFEQISFTDEAGNIIKLNNYTDSEKVKFEYYYYLNMKCFQISLTIVYEEKDFLFSDDPFQFKIWFNKVRKNKKDELLINFTVKKRGTMQFNQFSQFLFRGTAFKKRKYQIKLELVETFYSDIKLYEILKQPKSLIYGSQDINDATSYMNGLQNGLKRITNKTTDSVAVGKNFSDLEIDQSLFYQYFLQVQNVSDNFLPISNNSKRHIYHNYIQEVDYTGTKVFQYINNPEIEFAISFFSQQVDFIREDNTAKLIQSILNSLSLFLNFCILDTFIFIYKLLILFFKFHTILKRLKIYFEKSF